jgi:hypothetical protein
MPAIPDQRVAPWQITRPSDWEDSSMGTAEISEWARTAAINPAGNDDLPHGWVWQIFCPHLSDVARDHDPWTTMMQAIADRG